VLPAAPGHTPPPRSSLLVGRFKVARAASEPIPSVNKQIAEGLVGTFSVSTANRLFGRRWVMFANVFLTSSMVAVPAVTANVWAAGAAAFLGGMGATLWVVNSRSISQMLVSAEMMGRYNSVARLTNWGPIALGAALAAALAQW
jgi:hypothetical protein